MCVRPRARARARVCVFVSVSQSVSQSVGQSIGRPVSSSVCLRAQVCVCVAQHGKLGEQIDTSGTQFLTIGIADDCIQMVDDLEGVALARTLLLSPSDPSEEGAQWVVGLDAEWQPSSGGRTIETGMTRVSILQLATATHVVLLDMMTLLQPSAAAGAGAELTPAEAAVDSLLADLFAQAGASVPPEKRSILVGFQFAGDLSRLAMSYPRLPCFRSGAPPLNIVDALQCAALVYPDLRVNCKRAGLGAVIETVFGAPLNKACQCSAWEDRPLSAPQRAYAALDAWCLVRTAEVVVEQLQRDSTSSVAKAQAGQTLTLKQAWQRVLAVSAPLEADLHNPPHAAEPDDPDGDDDSGDGEQAKLGAVAYGRDGVVPPPYTILNTILIDMLHTHTTLHHTSSKYKCCIYAVHHTSSTYKCCMYATRSR